VAVHFDDFLVTEKERYSAYNLHQFIADCGGLIGLFTGCSILSIMEIFYHIVLWLIALNKTAKPLQFRQITQATELTEVTSND